MKDRRTGRVPGLKPRPTSVYDPMDPWTYGPMDPYDPAHRPYLMNSISRYVGSGHISCGTFSSSASPALRSFSISGMTLSRKYFACFDALSPLCSSALASCVDVPFSASICLASVFASALAFLRRRAGGLGRDDRLADFLLVLERRRQDVAVGHQHHELRFDVDRLVVDLEGDLLARVQLAGVQDLLLLEGLDDR